MNQLKKALVATGASFALAVGAAGVASADAINNCSSGFELVGGKCIAISHDRTTTTTYTVNGNCSGIIQTYVDQENNNSTAQSQDTNTGNLGGNVGGLAGHVDQTNDQTATADPSQSNSTSQSNSSTVTFAPDCSTTQVTQQVATTAAAKTAAPAAQVKAPAGGVGAGEGGAVGSAVAPVLALGGSVVTLGAGVARLRKAGLGFNA